MENPAKLKLWNQHFNTNLKVAFSPSSLTLAKGKMATRLASGKALCELAAEKSTTSGRIC